MGKAGYGHGQDAIYEKKDLKVLFYFPGDERTGKDEKEN
jgi:hypothetical protein